MRKIPLLAAASTLSGFFLSTAAIQGNTIDFNGNGPSWSSGTNWDGGTAPADDITTDIARFNQTSYTNQPNSGTSHSVTGITVGDGATFTAALNIGGTSLTLGASGIDMKAGAGAVTVSPTTLALGANQVWNNSSSNLLTISSAISGGFAIEQTGSGIIVINNAINPLFTGGYTLTSGTTYLNRDTSNATALDATTTGFTVQLGTGTVTLNGGLLGSTSSARYLVNAVTLNGNVQLGVIDKVGAVLLAGGVNVTGDSQISLINGGGGFYGNTATLNGNLTIDTEISVSPVIGNNFTSDIVDGSDSHGLIKNGTGIIALGGNNTYSGGTTINAGTIWAGSASGLGTGAVTLNGGTLDLRNHALVTGALAGSSGTITNSASSATTILTVGQGNGSGTFEGNLTQSTSVKVIAVTKNGTGTQKLGGTNNYMGQTRVNTGTLLVNGTHIDQAATTTAVNGYGSTTTGHYQVANGATLGGTGHIQGSNTSLANSNLVLVQSGGHLAPGDGIGALTLDGTSFGGTGSRVLNMAAGAVFDFQLSGTGGTPDQINFWNYVAGDLLLNGNALNLSLSGTSIAGTYTVDLFNFFSNAGSSVTTTTISNGLILGSLGTGIDSAIINFNPNTIGLTYTVTTVPEPASFALLGGIAALAFSNRRRRSA